MHIALIDFNFEGVTFGRCGWIDFWNEVVDLFLLALLNATIAGFPLSLAMQLTQAVFVVVPNDDLSCLQSEKLTQFDNMQFLLLCFSFQLLFQRLCPCFSYTPPLLTKTRHVFFLPVVDETVFFQLVSQLPLQLIQIKILLALFGLKLVFSGLLVSSISALSQICAVNFGEQSDSVVDNFELVIDIFIQCHCEYQIAKIFQQYRNILLGWPGFSMSLQLTYRVLQVENIRSQLYQMDSTNFSTNLDHSNTKNITQLAQTDFLPSHQDSQKLQTQINQALSDSLSSNDDFEEQIVPIQDQSQQSSKSSFSDFDDYDNQQSQVAENEKAHDETSFFQQENIRLQLQDQERICDKEQQPEFGQKQKEFKPKGGQKMKISLRSFQATLIQNSRDRNSIIYLPTGTGKTRISICSMYYYLSKYGTSKKIVFLANTIQLVKQQAEAIKQTLAAIISNESFAKDLRQKLGGSYINLGWKIEDLNNHVVCVHGERSEDQTITKRKRIQAYMTTKKQFLNEMKKATVTVMISQMFLNCLRRGYIKLTDYSFMVFDECHHCGGDHPYSGIMKQFYFQQKKKIQMDEQANRVKDEDRLPIIMGLTASPVLQPYNDYRKLSQQLQNLCVNLDSNFSYYPFGEDITSNTQILIKKIVEPTERQLMPDLIEHFDRYKDHAISLDKIKIHFPIYFQCVKQVITKMSEVHRDLDVQVEGSSIIDPELYLFYDLKECLLQKLRDLWLQLGQFAFSLGFHEMCIQLNRLTGMRNIQNTALLQRIKAILKNYDIQFKSRYGKCKPQFMSSKLISLIEILKPQNEQVLNQNKVNDMVLVFAFKRRTVKYLQMVLQKYRDQLSENEKKFFKSVGVTGYANNQKVYRTKDGHSQQSNPSAQEDEATINKLYNRFMENQRQHLRNKIHLQSSMIGDNKTLNNQMDRMYSSKMGKLLLEVEEKYHNQIKKIIQFKKKEHRVLITTSVTEEGFDIPGCNLVISFDTPFSMKSYIQIKGRARKKSSKYIIFTTQRAYKKMSEDKKIYDNTINAIYQLAIGQIAKKDIRALEKIKQSPSYQKVKTRGGALLNTNYALQLLKSYFTSLKPPNRPYFHFIQTSNICFKCVIKFPESSTCKNAYAVGKPQPRKQEALKSAAFSAVKILKTQGFIRDDLRPSRLEELQEQLQLQKYDDIGIYSKDNNYKQIFDKYVQIDEDFDSNTKKKIIRFYYKSLQPQKLQFHNINRKFDRIAFEKNEEFTFQIYLVKFSNKINRSFFEQKDSVHQIGILSCYQPQETQQIFARFRQSIQPTSKEEFELRLVDKQLYLTKQEYENYKTIHNFLLAGQKNIEVDYYNQLNDSPIVIAPQWSNAKAHRKVSLKLDFSRKYFPLMVLLKRTKEGKQVKYRIDQNLNEKIVKHIQLFKKVYTYHNNAAKSVDKLFDEDLTTICKNLVETLKGYEIQDKRILVQTFSKDMCFHKGLLTSSIQKYSKDTQKQDEKSKKGRLKTKYQRIKRQYIHFKNQNNIEKQPLVKFMLWKNASKDDINQYLNKEAKIKTKLQDSTGSFRFLRQFVLYPLSYPTMLRISLIYKYVFHVFQDFSVALYFRKFYLSQIFDSLKFKIKGKELQNYRFAYYKSVVLDNSQKLYIHLQSAGKCKYLRDLGRTLIAGQIKANDSNLKFDVSSIQNHNMSLDQSMKINQNQSHILNASLIDQQQTQSNFPSILSSQAKEINFVKQKNNKKEKEAKYFNVNLDVMKNLKIEDILRALTSKIYRHLKSANYEEFQFIGDVVLKYLATMQIFLERTESEQGEMHIARANLICNANLHRAAIKKKLFQYIFTTKKSKEVTPLVQDHFIQKKMQEKKKYGSTDIQVLGEDDDDAGYQYIPGKVHADVLEALIGIFYLKNKNLNDCQTLLYAFGVLSKPNLQIFFDTTKEKLYELPPYFCNLEQKIKYKFKHKELLIQSLTHPYFLTHIEDVIDDNQTSFSRLFNNRSNLNNSGILNLSLLADQSVGKEAAFKKSQTFYERMEFLGDAFLDLLVVEYLYDQGGDYLDDEGTLSFLKQSAVSNKTLGFISLQLGLQEYMFVDLDQFDVTIKEFRSIGKSLDHLPSPLQFSKLKIGSLKLLGDIFESLIGAILIDNDFRYEDTKQVVMRLIGTYIKHFTSISFIQQCPTYQYKQYLSQNNYKKFKLVKVVEEGMVDGQYLYRLTDKKGNTIGQEVRASNDKDAWDELLEISK